MSLLQREVKLAMARLVANRVQQKLGARQIADRVILKVGQVPVPAATTGAGGPPRVPQVDSEISGPTMPGGAAPRRTPPRPAPALETAPATRQAPASTSDSWYDLDGVTIDRPEEPPTHTTPSSPASAGQGWASPEFSEALRSAQSGQGWTARDEVLSRYRSNPAQLAQVERRLREGITPQEIMQEGGQYYVEPVVSPAAREAAVNRYQQLTGMMQQAGTALSDAIAQHGQQSSQAITARRRFDELQQRTERARAATRYQVDEQLAPQPQIRETIESEEATRPRPDQTLTTSPTPATQPEQDATPESPEQANAEAQEALTSPPPVPEDDAAMMAQNAAQMLEMDPNDPGLEAAMRGSVDEAAASFANDVVSRTTPGFMDWMTSNWQNLLVPAGIAAIAIGGVAGGTAGRIGQVLGLLAAGYGGYDLYQRWNNLAADPSQISDPTEQARIRFIQGAVQQAVLQAQQEGGQPFGDPAAATQAAAAETGLSQDQAAQWMQQAQQAVADARLMVGLGFTGQLRERVRQSAHEQFAPVYESIRQAQGGQQQ